MRKITDVAAVIACTCRSGSLQVGGTAGGIGSPGMDKPPVIRAALARVTNEEEATGSRGRGRRGNGDCRAAVPQSTPACVLESETDNSQLVPTGGGPTVAVELPDDSDVLGTVSSPERGIGSGRGIETGATAGDVGESMGGEVFAAVGVVLAAIVSVPVVVIGDTGACAMGWTSSPQLSNVK